MQDSPLQRYLVMVSMATSAPSPSYDGSVDVFAHYNWDSIWDGRGWAALEQECKKGNVKCSCIIAGVTGNENRAKKIKELCEAVRGTHTNVATMLIISFRWLNMLMKHGSRYPPLWS